MEIRKAAEADLPQIAALYRRNHFGAYRGLLPEAYFAALSPEACAEKWAKALHDPEHTVLTACEGERFLGFAAGMPDAELAGTWYLESLHVEEAARGKGVGTALIRAAAALAREAGFERMSICIVRGNDGAGALYRRLGAEHLKYFEDDFAGTVSHSEKLVWNSLPAGAE